MALLSCASNFARYVQQVIGFLFCGVFIWSWQPCPAQESQPASDLLLQQNPTENLIDELPIPQSDSNQTALNSPTDEGDAAQRIYLGLEAEEQPTAKGLRVATVTRESPAWKAGFAEDDRIIGINGFSINSMNDMVEQLGKARPGQSLTFLINRSGRTRELTAVLISQAMAERILGQADSSGSDAAWVGLTVHDLSDAFREQFGVAAYRGVAVSRVATGSPAHRAGIKAGDAITEIEARPVESAQDFMNWLESARPGDQASMIVYRGITRLPTQVVLDSEPRPQPTKPTFRQTPPPPKPLIVRRSQADNSPSTDSDSGVDSQLVEQPNSAQTAPVITPRELQLEAEVERLQQELADAQAKLAETRQQLNSILRSLRD